ncbi:MAG: hypothetical protein Q9205_007775, partial [Flavoplaca limonia]
IYVLAVRGPLRMMLNHHTLVVFSLAFFGCMFGRSRSAPTPGNITASRLAASPKFDCIPGGAAPVSECAQALLQFPKDAEPDTCRGRKGQAALLRPSRLPHKKQPPKRKPSNGVARSVITAALSATVLISSIIAFALAICCLLAGTNPATLQNMQLFTLNTSGIGTHIQRQMGLPPPDSSFNISSVLLPRDIVENIDSTSELLSTRSDKVIDDAVQAIKDPKATIDGLKTNITATVDDGKKKLTSAAKDVKNKAKNATAKIVSTFINETIDTLGIQDFYQAHLLTYCEGLYTNRGGKRNITFCSNGNPNRLNDSSMGVNPRKDDGPFGFISELHLPDPVSSAMKAVTLLTKLIAVLYGLGLFLLLVSILACGPSIASSFTSLTGGSSRLRKVSLAATITAFLCLLLGTILAKFLSTKIAGFFASNEGMGIQADAGKNFLGVSIAALVFTGIATTVAAVDLMTGRAASKMSSAG